MPLWGFRFSGPSAYSCTSEFRGLDDTVGRRGPGCGKEGPKAVEGQDPDTGPKILNSEVSKDLVLSAGVKGEEKRRAW